MRKAHDIVDSVYATICWFDIFDQPVTAKELYRFLFFQKASLIEVQQILKRDKRITSSFGFYCLRGRNALILRRCQRQYRAEKMWRQIFSRHFVFRWTPFLRLAAVGNTLAMNWPESKSDIDFFIVADAKRLFTARFFLSFFTQLFRLRRHGRKIAGRFCLSFFIANSSQNLENLKISNQDPYLAFWIATLVPVFGDFSSEFFAANTWIKKYFPNLRMRTTQKKVSQVSLFELVLHGKFGDILEQRLKKWQLKRARKKNTKHKEKTAVIVSEEILKFHETDRRREFYEKWQRRIQKSNLKLRVQK